MDRVDVRVGNLSDIEGVAVRVVCVCVTEGVTGLRVGVKEGVCVPCDLEGVILAVLEGV
jgi:hypothetical protein